MFCERLLFREVLRVFMGYFFVFHAIILITIPVSIHYCKDNHEFPASSSAAFIICIRRGPSLRPLYRTVLWYTYQTPSDFLIHSNGSRDLVGTCLLQILIKFKDSEYKFFIAEFFLITSVAENDTLCS